MKYRFGSFVLDPDRFELRSGSSPVGVEPQVFSVLVHLVANRQRMVTKDELALAVWGGRAVSDASIASRIRSARTALGDDGRRQALIRTVHGRGFRFVGEAEELAEPPPARASAPDPTPDDTAPAALCEGQPSIAVMPFRPVGLPPELAILADAIPHDVIQALSRLRWLAVIARGSSFRFRQAEPDVTQIARALGALYVLSGTVEVIERRVAVALELAGGRSGQVLWADRLEVPLGESAGLREAIATEVVAQLELVIPANEARAARRDGLDRLDAWSSYHLGLHHLYRFGADDNRRAQACFERAVALDPCFARAHAGLSFTRFLDAFLHFAPDADAAATAARRHSERALDLDPLDPFANFTMGRSFWLTGEPELAVGWLERATRLNPNYAQGFYASAFTAMLTGEAARIETGIEKALRLSPLDPLRYGMLGVRALAGLQRRDFDEAAVWADRAASTAGAHYLIGMIALVANGLAGRPGQAARWSERVRRSRPDAAPEHFFAAFPMRNEAARALIASELSRQGF